MTDYYVGIGGNDGNGGTTWVLRKETITAGEGLLSANDILYIGPGTYRGNFATTQDGTSGNPIIWWGDVTGEYTDGIGGRVRLTGLADDSETTPTDNGCIRLSGDDYREFYNLTVDMTSDIFTSFNTIYSSPGCVFENCVFGNNHSDAGSSGVIRRTGSSEPFTIRNCVFFGYGAGGRQGLYLQGDNSACAFVVENCIFHNVGIYLRDINGGTIRNNLIISATETGGIYSLAGELGSINIYQNVFVDNIEDISVSHPTINNDYNISLDSDLDGANTIESIMYFDQPVLLAGFKFPEFNFFMRPNNRTAVTLNGDTNAPSFDMYNLTRPASGKKTPGPFQYRTPTRETTVVHSGDTSMQLPDAGRVIYLAILKESVSHTISIFVHREANYTGTLPQMIIKRINQADITVTDIGASGQYNLLKHTFTPSASDKYAQIEFVSNNTAASGSYKVYFDKFLIRSKGRETKKFMIDQQYIYNLNKKPVKAVWIIPSSPTLSPTVEEFESFMPPYIN